MTCNACAIWPICRLFKHNLTLTILVLAIAFDLLLGDPPNRFHPVAAMGAFIHWAAGHAPTQGALQQFCFGTLLTLGGSLLFILPIVGLQLVSRTYPWLHVLINALLLKAAFSLQRLLQSGRTVEAALQRDDLIAARGLVSRHLVSRDMQALGRGHVASAAIESLAENLSDSFVAPLLAFFVGGLPLVWFYRFVNTADAMIGYRDERNEFLGKFTALLDDVLNWIPARLTGLAIVLAAPFVGGKIRHAADVMFSDYSATTSPNAGWPMSAAAGALGVTLEKIGYYKLHGGASLPDWATIPRARLLMSISAFGVLCFMTLAWGLMHVL